MHKKKWFIYPRVDWKTRVFNHTVDWLESLYPRKVAFITATYVLYMNGKGQVSLFRGIPEMLSSTKSSFSSTIVSHRCRIDACFFLLQKNLPGAWIRAKGDSDQSTEIWQQYFGLCSFITSSTRYKEKASQANFFYHSVYCITEITINRLSVPFF